jgi:hypothetical protein
MESVYVSNGGVSKQLVASHELKIEVAIVVVHLENLVQ